MILLSRVLIIGGSLANQADQLLPLPSRQVTVLGGTWSRDGDQNNGKEKDQFHDLMLDSHCKGKIVLGSMFTEERVNVSPERQQTTLIGG